MKYIYTLCLLFVLATSSAFAQQVVVTDNITGNTTWTSDNEYILNGLVFVDSLATLTIQPGTVVKARFTTNITTGEGASALIVRRGGNIEAQGAANNPIIFTSEFDDLNDGSDLDNTDRGLWGGIIILGEATTNETSTNIQIEGIPAEQPALYGGSNDADDSGTLSYVSIRHGGFSISGVPGDEINGLTMGAVGSGTTIDHIEVFANFDDCYEWFGGTVNTKYLVGAFCGDDTYDYDQGFRGKGQYWFSIQGDDVTGRAGEHDGGDTNETGTPLSNPIISNVTYIGSGATATNIGGDGNDRAFAIRDNAAGKYFNSIFTDFAGVGMNIEDLGSGDDSRLRLENGDLLFSNNLWFGFGAGATAADIFPQDFVETNFAANTNDITDPQLGGISRTTDGGLDPTLADGSPALTGASFANAALTGDAFFDNVAYKGAFNGTVNWLDGWTTLSQLGFTGTPGAGGETTVLVTNDITGNVTWTADNVYELNGLVFVDSLASLTIEPGTVVKARFTSTITTGEGASALIVRRGGTIDAQGSATNPIIFTSQYDDVNDPDDLLETDRGLWGGIILLGQATTNETSTNIQIEGIPSELPALYGGSDDADNSGTLRYVSIRHGGYSISGVPGDEINGLTMGAVGSGTTIENIEVYANFDDCYEWFGGTVNTKYLVGAFCGDDTFDYDQGFRGHGQFWFSIQGDDVTGRAGEHDGGDTNETGEPFSIPTISNVTYIGSGATATNIGGDGNDRAFAIRDNAGGKYYNSIFTDFAGVGMNIEDLGSGEDSRSRLENGDLVFSNNLWFGFGAGNTAEAILPQEFVRTNFVAANNAIVDPALRGISRDTDGGLDPRLALGSPATSAADYPFIAEDSPAEDFFAQVPYQGAFGGTNWLLGWTALDNAGFAGDIPLGTATGEVIVTNDISANTEWTADNVYVLDGLVFVNDGATLSIQPGTRVEGRFSTNISSGEGASALIVRRGGQVNAQGTASDPIIFTSEFDDGTLDATDRGLWGGIILLGSATTNETSTNIQIEGIPAELPALYGGTNDEDNSGTLRYVSIRHGGFSISGVPGDEINGLTMGAVGSGTTIEYVEVFANFDDCFEWFGGTVNTSNLVGAFCGDDTFDYDQGFRGHGQFWFSIQGDDVTGRAGEHDGGDTNETGEPFSIPTISNVTYIGSGATATNIGGDGNDRAFAIRDNAGGKYYNSIFTDFAGVGMNIEDLGSGEDSRSRLENGDLVFSNNLWFGFGAGNTAEAILPQEFVRTNFVAANNAIVDPALRGISRDTDGGLDPRLALGSPATSAADYPFIAEDSPAEDFFAQVPYQGAFGGTNWLLGWTGLDDYGFAGDIPLGSATGEVIVTNDISADTEWTADNVYVLDGLVFVNDGATLSIQPGTRVEGRFSTNISSGEGASALVVRRGGQIDAQGTADSPIIFTSEFDDGTLEATDRGLWGGIILLGSATTNETSTNIQIEGIPAEQPAEYGGTNDEDNSGTLRYVSIRHGGFSISGVPGDEINGLTMGAVGSGTTIEYVEVFANFDDCFEWFGGTVNTKYLVGAFCGDDTYDYDQGFRGHGQFWFSIQGDDVTGRAGEHDGGDTNETGEPFSIPTISNVTYIGSGATATNIGGDGNDRAFAIRDNAGGKYYNSIFTDFAGVGMNIEDLGSGEDSRSRLENGDLVFSNNLWFGFGAGISATDIFPQEFVRTNFTAAGNEIENPSLRGVSRTTDGGLDPRLSLGSPATSAADYPFIAEDSPAEDFFAQVPYQGAFGGTNWLLGWTGLDDYGFAGDIPLGTATNEVVVTDDITTDTQWTNDNIYVLNGLVFVDNAELTIDAGTTIKGRFNTNISTGEGASALIVRRGATIDAQGNEENPIIFTSEFDTDDDELTSSDRGLWGGVILLGSATTNETSTNIQIEGIPAEQPAEYGGTNDEDNSGTLRYVSIRHGGFSISGVPGDEINGLTMGAVGSGTTIEYVEVFANFDDCFEWFGGTVNTRNLVGAFCGDDTFDYDQGFRGFGQFWFSIQGDDVTGRGGEHDGGDTNETGEPFSIPVIGNVTYIGSGATATNIGGDGNDRAFAIRDNAGGKYYNSIFTDFAGVGVNIEDLDSGEDSRSRLENGDIVFENNIWFGFGAGNTPEDILPQDFVRTALLATGNQIADPQITGISRTENGGLNPIPASEGPAFSSTVTYLNDVDAWFQNPEYVGAFDTDGSWVNSWTALADYGILGDAIINSNEDETVEVLPTAFELSQNYPNPFNPSTNIEFALPATQRVTLKVYDMLGREVATLINNETVSAGSQTVRFDASGLSSGIYIYRLTGANTSITKRMTLIK